MFGLGAMVLSCIFDLFKLHGLLRNSYNSTWIRKKIRQGCLFYIWLYRCVFTCWNSLTYFALKNTIRYLPYVLFSERPTVFVTDVKKWHCEWNWIDIRSKGKNNVCWAIIVQILKGHLTTSTSSPHLFIKMRFLYHQKHMHVKWLHAKFHLQISIENMRIILSAAIFKSRLQ